MNFSHLITFYVLATNFKALGYFKQNYQDVLRDSALTNTTQH